jgi:hypothetical protein
MERTQDKQVIKYYRIVDEPNQRINVTPLVKASNQHYCLLLHEAKMLMTTVG